MSRSPVVILYDENGSPIASAQFESVVGHKALPVAARGTGGYYPSPECVSEGGGSSEGTHLQADSAGQLMVRGPIFTDEESYRDDFSSAIISSLTGTVTFVAASTTVSGSGTSFTTEVSRTHYVKLSSDSDEAWTEVLSVVSDTEIELLAPYSGTGGSGTASYSQWVVRVGTGGSASASSSILTLASGTTSSSRTSITRRGDYLPVYLQAHVSLSQRIANQEFYVGVVDSVPGEEICALAVFDGTDNTKVRLRTASAAGASNIEESLVSLPNGMTSASSILVEVSVLSYVVFLSVNGVKLVEHRRHVPGPYTVLVSHVGWVNSGVPGSSSSALVDSLLFQNQDRVEIADGFRGDALPVQIREDVHTLSGYLTTSSTGANQVICSYTVPSGKVLFALGYAVSSGTTSVNGNPMKIGKGAMTETVSPGVIDGQCLRTVFVPQKNNVQESFSAPLYLASSGETVQITVTPDGVTSTTWRGQLDFILR